MLGVSDKRNIQHSSKNYDDNSSSLEGHINSPPPISTAGGIKNTEKLSGSVGGEEMFDLLSLQLLLSKYPEKFQTTIASLQDAGMLDEDSPAKRFITYEGYNNLVKIYETISRGAKSRNMKVSESLMAIANIRDSGLDNGKYAYESYDAHLLLLRIRNIQQGEDSIYASLMRTLGRAGIYDASMPNSLKIGPGGYANLHAMCKALVLFHFEGKDALRKDLENHLGADAQHLKSKVKDLKRIFESSDQPLLGLKTTDSEKPLGAVSQKQRDSDMLSAVKDDFMHVLISADDKSLDALGSITDPMVPIRAAHGMVHGCTKNLQDAGIEPKEVVITEPVRALRQGFKKEAISAKVTSQVLLQKTVGVIVECAAKEARQWGYTESKARSPKMVAGSRSACCASKLDEVCVRSAVAAKEVRCL